MQRIENLVDLEKTVQNEYLDAKIGVDTVENEPSKVVAEKSERSSVSNFPPKIGTAGTDCGGRRRRLCS